MSTIQTADLQLQRQVCWNTSCGKTLWITCVPEGSQLRVIVEGQYFAEDGRDKQGQFATCRACGTKHTIEVRSNPPGQGASARIVGTRT